MPLSKYVVAKVILVPGSVKTTVAGHGKVTRNNATTAGQRIF